MTQEELKQFEGPQKYWRQRDAPLEIPIEVIKKLFLAVD